MAYWFPPVTVTLACILSCQPAFSAEGDPDQGTSEARQPAPQSKSSRQPVKIEYDKLPYATLRKKAEAGDTRAQFELGSRHNYGRDLPKNTREALRWLRQAAQAGHPEAQRLLAVKLFEGHDVPVDHEEAFKWAQRLADSGDRPGQLMLGTLYANGEGTGRNLIRAYMWFDIAATPVTGKDPESADKEVMMSAASARDKTAGLLHAEEEAEAQQLASDWWLTRHVSSPAPAPKKSRGGKPAGIRDEGKSAS